jgi:hypothetical protein
MVKWLVLKVITSEPSDQGNYSQQRTLFYIWPDQGNLRKIKPYPLIQLEPSMP